jgi:hypothetical protein
MEAGKITVIYTGLIPGPNKTNEICGKTIAGTMHPGSTVYKMHRNTIVHIHYEMYITTLGQKNVKYRRVVWAKVYQF